MRRRSYNLLAVTALAAALLGLPLMGVWLGGLPPARYLEFPPATQYVDHAPFAWPAFLALAAALVAIVLPFVRRVARSSLPPAGGAAHQIHRTGACERFPWWGWGGLALTACAWIVAWTRLPAFSAVQRFTFSPLWFGYILVVNALTQRRSGTCMLRARPRSFLALFPVSAAFWWFFEYLNRFVQNWAYEGSAGLTSWQYFWFATLPFSTVLPAVMGTDALLSTWPRLTAGLDRFAPLRVRAPRRAAGLWLALGIAGLALVGVLPDYTFPLLWLAPLVLITASQALAGRPTLFAPLAVGDWRRVVRLALAAFVCGCFWELWNVHSYAKWVYHVPFVQRFHIFEMPILGYAGYLPFGLECAVIADAVGAWLVDRNHGASHSRTSLVNSLCRSLLAGVLFVLGVLWLPYTWCSRHADAWFDGQPDRQRQLANGVAEWLDAGLGREHFRTGSPQFDGEWLFGTYLMAGLGYGQLALQQPDRRDMALRNLHRCSERIRSAQVRAFDDESWRNDPLATLTSPTAHHAAYLGYYNLLLGLGRLLDPVSPDAELNDRISAALRARLEHAPTLLLESYPGEVYPVDNCAVIASLALHARATLTDYGDLFARWERRFREHSIDADTGLMIQAVWPEDGSPADAPRGSGTTLGLYFLSFWNPALSRDLYAATRRELARRICGFGGVREYPRTVRDAGGDVDSGPVVMGMGLSPTGFLIAGSRIHGDRDMFRRLYATGYAWGAPLERDDTLHFVTGASLGDAILFAMLTALPDGIHNGLITGISQTAHEQAH